MHIYIIKPDALSTNKVFSITALLALCRLRFTFIVMFDPVLAAIPSSELERRHGSTRALGHAFLVAHGCVHILYNSSWKFHQFAAGQLLSGLPVQYGKGGCIARTSCTKSHLSVTFLQPARRAAVLGQPSTAFGLIGWIGRCPRFKCCRLNCLLIFPLYLY